MIICQVRNTDKRFVTIMGMIRGKDIRRGDLDPVLLKLM
jgi:hypothetical protein